MAGNAESTCRAIAGYIGATLAIETRFVDGLPWQAREALLDAGEIQLCWICGLPYVWKADAPDSSITLCAVPVMRRARYEAKPVYFSDVVVRRDSAYESFADLRGASWAFNEPRSHSGYNVVRHHLSQLGETSGYFGSSVESGAHQESLRMIIRGEIDASAIDSTVLETELHRFAHLQSEIRIIDTLGPSPMPPWVMHRSVAPELRAAVAGALLGMHRDSRGRAILDQWGISHFCGASDSHYDPIREMSRQAQAVSLS
ncbi:MAG: transporter, phosphonate, periplasmic substrate-binding protein [Betaproteobacteria bacterium]|nr:transporter, phosphonate, periplasmic substrate-binding protein [Betaproteobacteria bacterium]